MEHNNVHAPEMNGSLQLPPSLFDPVTIATAATLVPSDLSVAERALLALIKHCAPKRILVAADDAPEQLVVLPLMLHAVQCAADVVVWADKADARMFIAYQCAQAQARALGLASQMSLLTGGISALKMLVASKFDIAVIADGAAILQEPFVETMRTILTAKGYLFASSDPASHDKITATGKKAGFFFASDGSRGGKKPWLIGQLFQASLTTANATPNGVTPPPGPHPTDLHLEHQTVAELYARALGFIESGATDDAVETLLTIISRDPGHAYAHNDLGVLLFQNGVSDKGLEHLRQAYALDGKDMSIGRNLAEVYKALGRTNDALTILRQLADQHAGDAATAAHLAEINSGDTAPSHIVAQTPPVQINYEKLRRWEQSIEQVTQKIAKTALQYLPQDGVMIDVGANVGLFTAQVLRERSCRAFLFEPVPEYFQFCRERFLNNSNIKVEQLALSDRPGSLSLWLGSENLGWNTAIREKTDSSMTEIAVPALTFDDYWRAQGAGQIDVIKIDVEGAEFKVLNGMRQTLRKLERKPVILCEIGWGPHSHPNWPEEQEAFEWLFSNGYERFDYNVPGTTDVVFRPAASSFRGLTTVNTNAQISSTQPAVTNPRITVGIPTRNRLEPLIDLLRSITQQTYKNFDLLISDDGDRYDLCAAIAQALPELKFRYIKGPGKSLPTNRQHILDNAHTELVLMCDDDHYMHPDCIQRLVQTILSDDRVGIVSAIWPHPLEQPRTVNFEQVKHHTEFRLDLADVSERSDFWWKNGVELFKSFHNPPRVLESEYAGGGCLIYRKSAVLIAGGFPADYSDVSFREDTDMSHRIYLSGYKVLVEPAAVAEHRRAESGGCKDKPFAWAESFVRDGKRFQKKLAQWRTRYDQLNAVRAQRSQIRVLMFYDEKGWAWWHRAHHIKRAISPHVQVDILQLGNPFDHRPYDFVLLFDPNLVHNASQVPREKLIIGNSCPLYLENTVQTVISENCAAGVVNNYRAFLQVKDRGRFFCCQNGVDTELFYPSPKLVRDLVVCWTGHSQSIGHKGLDLIRTSCAAAGVELLTVDAAMKQPGVEANTQEWVRDNLYHQSSVYVCASEFEGTPNPALEALACGIPVITTAVGNMPELIVDGYNGFIVERSAEAISAALRQLKRLDREVLARNARTTIELGWSWKAQARKYEHMFWELLRRQSYGDFPEVTISEAEVIATAAEIDPRHKPRATWR